GLLRRRPDGGVQQPGGLPPRLGLTVLPLHRGPQPLRARGEGQLAQLHRRLQGAGHLGVDAGRVAAAADEPPRLLPAARLGPLDEAVLLQHPQVEGAAGHRLPGELGALGGGELAVVLEQVEQLEPQGVGHRPDPLRVVDDELLLLGHAPTLGRRLTGSCPALPRRSRWCEAGGVMTVSHDHGGVMWVDGGPPPTPVRQRRRPSWALLGVAVLLALVVGALATLGITGAGTDQAPREATTQERTGQPGHGATPDEGTGQPAPPDIGPGQVPDWVRLAEEVGPSVVAIDVRTRGGAGQGSGVIVDGEGRIITNHHVVAGGTQILVTLWDGRLYPASVVGTDVATDLAVIALDDPPDDLIPATLGDSDTVRVGQHVAAIGNPLGLSHTVTTGIVSALDRPVTTVEEGRLPGERRTAI